MPTLKEIRKDYPMYSDMSDGEFAKAFHNKYYSDLDFKDFSRKVGYLKGADPGEYDPESPEWKEKYSPAAGMGTGEKVLVGAQQGLANLWRGIRQRSPGTDAMHGRAGNWAAMTGDNKPLMSHQDVADARKLDEPLLNTTAGRVGSLGGTVLGGLPAAFVPGANTYGGTALIGGILGALQPSTSTKETLTNTAFGGIASPLTMGAFRGLVGLGRGARSMFWDPLTKGGQERIAANTLQSFAGGADEAAQAAANIRQGLQDVLPGAKPGTAELANNAGLANLERILKNNPEYTQDFARAAATNRNAITTALDDIAGSPALRTAAVESRSAAAAPLYSQADNVVVQADDALTKLLSRPSMQKAVDKAGQLAAEAGEEFSTETLSGRNLHILKMAMDDLADNPMANGIAGNEARAVKGTRDAFLSWLEGKIPAYGEAREAFKAGSQPINQMDVGSALRDKLIPALSDFGAETRLRPQAFAQALRDGDATAANVLGRSSASINDVMTPDQMKTLGQVAQQLARRVNADELGKAVGSNTGQNLIGQNVLRQFLGPLGLSQKATERVAAGPLLQGVLGSPAKVAEKVTGSIGEPNILKALVRLGLTPEEAIKLLERQASNSPGVLRFGGAIPAAVSGANTSRK